MLFDYVRYNTSFFVEFITLTLNGVSKFPITLKEFMPPELMDIPGFESLSCQVIQVLGDSAYTSHIAPALPL